MLTQAARGWGEDRGGGFAQGHLAPGPALPPRAMDRDPHRLRTHKAPDRGPRTLPGPGIRVGGGGGVCGRQAPTLRGEESCGEGSIARCSWGPSPAQPCITGRSQEASGWAASLWALLPGSLPPQGPGEAWGGRSECSSAPPGGEPWLRPPGPGSSSHSSAPPRPGHGHDASLFRLEPRNRTQGPASFVLGVGEAWG